MPGVGLDSGPEDREQMVDDDFDKKREEMQRVAKDCVVVVDNIPKIGSDKFPRLVSILTTKFESMGRLRRDENDKPRLTFARSDDGSTLGFAFAEYISPEEAHKALALLHNFQLDRHHRFWACTAGDLEILQEVPEEFVPPPQMAITERDRPNFKSWLLDERGRDQFMIRHEDETSIFWHDHIVKPQLVSCHEVCPVVPVPFNNELCYRSDVFIRTNIPTSGDERDLHPLSRTCGFSSRLLLMRSTKLWDVHKRAGCAGIANSLFTMASSLLRSSRYRITLV